jgi:hypothetical protein
MSLHVQTNRVPTDEPLPSPPRPKTKTAALVKKLQNPKGIALAQLFKAFNWQPHSARAALSGLRKRGYAIDRFVANNGVSRYRLINAEMPND